MEVTGSTEFFWCASVIFYEVKRYFRNNSVVFEECLSTTNCVESPVKVKHLCLNAFKQKVPTCILSYIINPKSKHVQLY